MLSVRFHGRGGHGVKTASRIVGTAAFLAGFYAQDSPVYGAERRGASVAAFTRLGETPILERGVIVHPDVIIVGDETLLDDSGAGVLVGQEAASVVFVNAQADTQLELAEKYKIHAPLKILDVTGLTLDMLGKASALSAGLAAAAARLLGVVEPTHLLEAVRQELGHLEVADEIVQRNLQLSTRIFESLQAVTMDRKEPVSEVSLCRIPPEDVIRGTPSIFAAGNAEERHTGSWRVERPEINYERCTRCGICFVRCPDGAIALDDQGYPVIDYDHCKGCMICWDQCPVEGALVKHKEVRSW